jgi:hypothetical protein
MQEKAGTSPRARALQAFQRLADQSPPRTLQRQKKTSNHTGLPEGLKAGVERLSGVSLDSVKVHYNSAKPAQLNAHAYAQGHEIHLAPGQDRHLPHEAWHVVQQAQGRVRPTTQLKGGVPINDDAGLESEADVMGQRALAPISRVSRKSGPPGTAKTQAAQRAPVQRTIFNMGDDARLAGLDGTKLERKLGQTHVLVPLPDLKSPDALVVEATNPFVIMFHGHTLRRLGVHAFIDLLVAKGYPRSRGLELVLITCSADVILGADDAQMLADTLQSKVRAAKGKVTVQPDGVPAVEVGERVHREDIFSLMGTEFEDFATGWHLYTPRPEESLKVITRDAARLETEADGLLKSAALLVKYKAMAPIPGAVDLAEAGLREFLETAGNLHLKAFVMKGNATATKTQDYRREVDHAQSKIPALQTRIEMLKEAWREKNGQSLFIHDLAASIPVATDTGEEGSGWDLGGDLDLGDLDDTPPAADLVSSSSQPTVGGGGGDHTKDGDVASLKAMPQSSSKPVLQAVMITPGEDLADGRTIDDLCEHLNDIGLVLGGEMNLRIDFGAVADNEFAVTRLLMNGVPEIAFVALTAANAAKAFTIEIILSEAMFQGGQREMPELIATLTHEWELHGREFAQNVHRLKTGAMPDVHLGHGHFFEPGTQGMDRAMAAGIGAANPEHRGPTRTAYLQDAAAHVDFVRRGWIEDDNAKAKSLLTAIRNMKESWGLVGQIQPAAPGADADAASLQAYARRQQYEASCTALLAAFQNGYFNANDDGTSAEMIAWELVGTPRHVWTLLVTAFATAVPPGDELYLMARDQFKPAIQAVMMDWPGFMDAMNLSANEGETHRETAMAALLP